MIKLCSPFDILRFNLKSHALSRPFAKNRSQRGIEKLLGRYAPVSSLREAPSHGEFSQSESFLLFLGMMNSSARARASLPRCSAMSCSTRSSHHRMVSGFSPLLSSLFGLSSPRASAALHQPTVKKERGADRGWYRLTMTMPECAYPVSPPSHHI